MSLHQVNSAFNLLGQTLRPTKSVRLPGPATPALNVSWGAFRQSLASNISAVFAGPSYARNYIYTGFFKDCWIEGRIPRIALLIALVLHLAILLVPFPRSLTAVRHNPAFDNTELTWSGPINDLPLLNLSSVQAKPAPHARPRNRPAHGTTGLSSAPAHFHRFRASHASAPDAHQSRRSRRSRQKSCRLCPTSFSCSNPPAPRSLTFRLTRKPSPSFIHSNATPQRPPLRCPPTCRSFSSSKPTSPFKLRPTGPRAPSSRSTLAPLRAWRSARKLAIQPRPRNSRMLAPPLRPEEVLPR